MPQHPPTPEQTHAIDLFLTGDSLKINAFAGTGKTTTLEYLAQRTSKRGVYLAFNKSIADDASKRFPPNVQCRTTHSLAYRSTPSEFKRQKSKMSDDLNPNAVAVYLNLNDLIIGSSFSLSSRSRGALIRQTLRQFQHSDATQISSKHVPGWGKMAVLPQFERQELVDDTVRMTRMLWERMLDPADSAPLGHDGYFKRWSLSEPEIPADFILLDEAQDTNPAMLAALKIQSAQAIYVGDRFQQIYEWRGAVNAMDKVSTKHECFLTQSFRFGDAIAGAATRLLRELGERQQICGNPAIKSELGCASPNAILCRTNAGVVDHIIQVFGAGLVPHVVGGTVDVLRLLDGVRMLMKGQPTDVPEFFGFQDWQEVVQFSQTEEGQHLLTFVNLVQRHGETGLRSYLSRTCQHEDQADVVVSTAHKAKGREWDNVLVVDDFIVIKKAEDGREVVDESELRLLYVALTRARHSVQIPQPLASRFGISQNYQPLRLQGAARTRYATATKMMSTGTTYARTGAQRTRSAIPPAYKRPMVYPKMPIENETPKRESTIRRLFRKFFG